MSNSHFTVSVRVTKVTPASKDTDSYGRVTKSTERTVTDLATIELRSDDLATILDNTVSHIDLLRTT